MALIGEMNYLTIGNSTYQIPISTVPTNVSAFTNDAGYLTSSSVYTKSEIDGLVAGVLHYKGTLSSTASLPSSSVTVGDVWHITSDGSEWAWDGSVWQELGTAVDLSNYITNVTASTVSVGSASTGTAISADDITAWTTNTPTVVSPATVVTGGSTASITPVSSKTVVTGGSTTEYKPVSTISTSSGTAASASVSNGVLTITNGSTPITSVTVSTTSIKPYTSLSTGTSVTEGTAVTVYKSLTTGPAATVTAGTAASLSYTSRSIPNISVTSKNVVSGITTN